MRSSSRQTLTGSQGSSGRPRGGVISGYVFRVIREQQGLTQEEAAEQLRVSTDTIAGWESGRRPLTAVPVGQMLVHRHRLMQMGTLPTLLQALDRALEADVLLAGALDEEAAVESSPLGAWVMQRDLVEVLAWPLNHAPPQPVRDLPDPPRKRRGPAPAGPELSASDRVRFFTRMRRTAERARRKTSSSCAAKPSTSAATTARPIHLNGSPISRPPNAPATGSRAGSTPARSPPSPLGKETGTA